MHSSKQTFFGMIRGAAGQNTHPEPKVFAQLFRLLILHSLVKPPKGSNISGGLLFKNLLDLQDLGIKLRAERREKFENVLDEIVMKGDQLENIPELLDEAHQYDYIDGSINEFALKYVAGFTSRHWRKLNNKCKNCLQTIQKEASDADKTDLHITLKSKHCLTYPSDAMTMLINALESAVMEVSANQGKHQNVLFNVISHLISMDVPFIGCPEHCKEVTSVVKFYIIMRMHFLSNEWNNDISRRKEMQKDHRKHAHLM